MSHSPLITERARKAFISFTTTSRDIHTSTRRERGMGNYRFKLSDMMPNAWFFKLKDIGKAKKQTTTHSKKKKQSSSASTTQSSKPKQTHQCSPRKSYYFTRDLNPNNKMRTSPANNPKIPVSNYPEPPRKSSKQRTKRRTARTSPTFVSSSISAGCSCRSTLESVWTKSDSPPEYSSSPFDSAAESEFPEVEFRTDRVLPTESFDQMVLLQSNPCGCRLNSSNNDIIINVDKNSLARKDNKLDGYDLFSELELPPIMTKPAKFNDMLSDAKNKGTRPKTRTRISTKEEPNLKGSLKVKIAKEDKASIKEQRNTNTPVRRFSVSSSGVKLRINSPRIASRKKIQAHDGRKSVSSMTTSSASGRRRNLSDSFAIVKSSFNPQKDFRESMVEMIVGNNIRASKDLEDLLAIYLSLNSDEYHDLIIKVFKQIWFDLTETR